LLGIIGLMLLRPSLTGPPLPGGPPGRPSPPGPEKMRVVRGTVEGFKTNTHLDVNAIQVKTSQAGVITIDFRPHTAKAVMGIAALHHTVEIQYSLRPDDESVGYQLHKITDIKTGNSVNVDELPPPPRVPPGQSAENFQVKDPQLITDQYGGIAAIRSGHLLFHFKPGQVDDISSLIKNSRELNMLAVSRDSQSGFVNAEGDRVYIVISITINNQTFLIR
jgi:hypothetical protein